MKYGKQCVTHFHGDPHSTCPRVAEEGDGEVKRERLKSGHEQDKGKKTGQGQLKHNYLSWDRLSTEVIILSFRKIISYLNSLSIH